MSDLRAAVEVSREDDVVDQELSNNEGIDSFSFDTVLGFLMRVFSTAFLVLSNLSLTASSWIVGSLTL